MPTLHYPATPTSMFMLLCTDRLQSTLLLNDSQSSSPEIPILKLVRRSLNPSLIVLSLMISLSRPCALVCTLCTSLSHICSAMALDEVTQLLRLSSLYFVFDISSVFVRMLLLN